MTRKRTGKETTKAVEKQRNPRGKMKEFTPKQVETLATILRDSDKLHAKRDYALFCVSIDMMARTSDILALSIGDVLVNGEIVEEHQFTQIKTGKLAHCVFTEETRSALKSYIGKFADTIRADAGRRIFKITPQWYREIIKEWAKALRLNPARYSGHSFRRTKAKMIYAETGNAMTVKELLGHTSLQHTQAYLDIEKSAALDVARKISPLRPKP